MLDPKTFYAKAAAASTEQEINALIDEVVKARDDIVKEFNRPSEFDVYSLDSALSIALQEKSAIQTGRSTRIALWLASSGIFIAGVSLAVAVFTA